MARRGAWALAAAVLMLPGVAGLPFVPHNATLAEPTLPALVGKIEADLAGSFGAGPRTLILVVDPGLWEATMESVEGLGIPLHAYPLFSMVAVVADERTMSVLALLPGVESIHPNETMHALLDRSATYVGARAVTQAYGAAGKGQTIIIMDSGIDGSHPDVLYPSKLVENVVPQRQSTGLVGGSKEGVVSSDPDGHGTHVAAIAAGAGKGDGKFRGVAPAARLIGYQAGLTGADGDVTFESVTVLEGFHWALENQARYGLGIVSNSWGANGAFDPRSPVNLATFHLYKAGMVVVFAAGNEGDRGVSSLNKYSVAPWVLSVGAGDYLNNVPEFASFGSDSPNKRFDHPDVVAPAIGITSAHASGGRGHLYEQKSGSSMSAPHVAGVAALLLSANPSLSPDDVMDILTETATPMPDYEIHEAGVGYVNALRAYQLAVKTEGQRDEFLSGKVKYGGPASGDATYSRDAVSVGYAKGEAHRLRSPDRSIASFALMLVATPQGLAFLVGSIGLAALAFAPAKPAPVVARAPMPVSAQPRGPTRS